MALSTKGKSILTLVMLGLIVAQQVGLWYGRSHRNYVQMQKLEDLKIQQVGAIDRAWQQAGLNDLMQPEKMGHVDELLHAKLQLQQIKIKIDHLQNPSANTSGKTGDLLKSVHTYYYNAHTKLLSAIEFLLSKEGRYEATKSGIHFQNEEDAKKLRELVNQINGLAPQREKINEMIREHNKSVRD